MKRKRHLPNIFILAVLGVHTLLLFADVIWGPFNNNKNNAQDVVTRRPHITPHVTHEHITREQEREAVFPGNTIRPGTVGYGTAFSVGANGVWLTARHVVDGCKNLYLSLPQEKTDKKISIAYRNGQRREYPVVSASVLGVSKTDDTALIVMQEKKADGTPLAFSAPEKNIFLGDMGFAVGYPGSLPGEIALQYIKQHRARMSFSGGGVSNVLSAWSIMEDNIVGFQYNGISGGPTVNQDGFVVGVNTGHSPRRARFYTSTTDSLYGLLRDNRVSYHYAAGNAKWPLRTSNYSYYADKLRQTNKVKRIFCLY